MRMILIQPTVKSPGHNFLPLGIGYLAAFLRERGHELKIFDLEVQKLSDEELLYEIESFKPEAVGLTVTIASAAEAKRLAKIFSGRVPWILYGGPQPTIEPESFLLTPNSIVVRGEGEETLAELCDALDSSNNISKIKGVSFLKDGRPFHNPERELIKNINSLPFPARDLYPLSLYEMYLRDKKATNIITSRGCPFECIFCYNMGGRIYRPRSAENVLAELQFLKDQYGFRAFSIYDDNFTILRQRLIEICQGMIERKMGMAWRCYSRVNTLDENLLGLMKKAGCFEIAFGVESGSQRSLDLMKKRIKVEDSKKVVRLCKKAGIVSKAFMMLGFPWETKEDIETSISFVEEVLPDEVQFMCVTPMPNTELRRMVLEKGYFIDSDADYTRLKHAVYGTENFTKEELDDLAGGARRRYKAARKRYALFHPFSFSGRVYFNEKARALVPYKIKRFIRKLQRKFVPLEKPGLF